MSQKPLSPLLGYNNNVRHKGRLFHVQTEDSGVKYGHIITHLFVDGGRVLKSVKTSYAEYIETDRRADIVRNMMRQQHKAMFIALRDGHFDSALDGTEGRKTAAQKEPTVPPPHAVQKTSAGRYSLKDEAVIADQAALTPSKSPAPARSAATTGGGPRPMAGSANRPAGAAGSVGRAGASARPSGSPMGPDRRRQAGTRAPAASSRPKHTQSAFGGDVDEQTLDEVILSYLSAEADADGSGKK
jgi:hypothetical protein